MNDTSQQPERGYPEWLHYVVIALAFVLLYYAIFGNARMETEPRYEIPYSQFKAYIQQDQVSEVMIRGRQVNGELQSPAPIGPEDRPVSHFRTRIPEFGDDDLISALEQHQVKVTIKEAGNGLATTLLVAFLPWLLLFALFYFIYRRASQMGGMGEMKKFMTSPAQQAEVPDVTFDGVAGQENAKREVTELIAYLKNPERFRKLGAEVPRGVLLKGAPGTGKTLMARALAGEAEVPFFSLSASQFIEMFVGVGASRVRKLFDEAKKNAPSIVFIDELDSVGRTRGTGLGGGHDEREQTLNQILAELDGFTGREDVIVLAATNRPDVLDNALLRPGRFDRHVTLDLPDRNDRVAILKVHMRDVPIADDVELEKLAAGTPGFSGADLHNLVNEAAMLAARKKHNEVTMSDFDEARDKLMIGTERSLPIQGEEKHRLATHEAGHTLVAYFLPHADPLYKVSIIPRGHALGGTQQLPQEERHTYPEEYLRDRLAVMFGGRCAEKMLLDSVSSGADDDIHQATNLARAMVSRWGMSDEIGPVDLRESEDHPFLGREMAQPKRYSEHAARQVDEAVRSLLLEAEQQASEMIEAHREQLEALIEALEEKETLAREAIEKCLGSEKHPEQAAERQTG